MLLNRFKKSKRIIAMKKRNSFDKFDIILLVVCLLLIYLFFTFVTDFCGGNSDIKTGAIEYIYRSLPV